MVKTWGTKYQTKSTIRGSITYVPMWEFQSKSVKNKNYRVSISNAGTVSCNCPGWTMKTKIVSRGGLFRSCTHVKQVLFNHELEVQEIYQAEFARVISGTAFVGGMKAINEQTSHGGTTFYNLTGPIVPPKPAPLQQEPVQISPVRDKKPKRPVADLDTIFNELG